MCEPSRQSGFTLIELLVALTVLSLGLVALLNATGENVRAATRIRANVIGEIIAENRMVETMLAEEELPIGTASGEVEMANGDWTWERRVLATPDSAMQRIEIRVRREGDAGTKAMLTAFRGTP